MYTYTNVDVGDEHKQQYYTTKKYLFHKVRQEKTTFDCQMSWIQVMHHRMSTWISFIHFGNRFLCCFDTLSIAATFRCTKSYDAGTIKYTVSTLHGICMSTNVRFYHWSHRETCRWQLKRQYRPIEYNFWKKKSYKLYEGETRKVRNWLFVEYSLIILLLRKTMKAIMKCSRLI